MLSKLSKLIMGLLWKKPMNPYELTKLVNMAMIQDWFPFTAPSIYTTIRNLKKKELIWGEALQEGKLPPKTIYTLTEAGEQALLADLLFGLSSYEAEASDFGIALFHIGMLSREDAIARSQQRLGMLDTLYAKAEKRLEKSKPVVPFNLKMMLTCNLYRIETEIRVTKELIREINDAPDWETSFVRFM